MSQVLIPRSNAAFKMGSASASSRHQGSQRASPKDMAPRIGLETRNPEVPSWIYWTFAVVVVIVGWFSGKSLELKICCVWNNWNGWMVWIAEIEGEIAGLYTCSLPPRYSWGAGGQYCSRVRPEAVNSIIP